jgi:hypothetical protein
MGRIVDLISEVASEADIGPEGVDLPADAFERLRGQWEEDDIDDARTLVHDRLLQDELVEVADSLSARLLEVLSEFGSATGFQRAQEGGAVISIDVIGQLARRLARLEEVLDTYREDAPSDRRAFEELRQRLMNLGIEEQMAADDDPPALPAAEEDDEDDDES